MSYGFQVTFDANDPMRLAEFWAEALGYVIQPPPDGYETWDEFADEAGIPEEERDNLAAIVDPAGNGPRLLFQKVPEPKVAKNRVHLDVSLARGVPPEERRGVIDTESDRLVGLGATRVADFDEPTGMWTVMTDPEGNEFCIQ